VVSLFRDYPFFFAIAGGDLAEASTFSMDPLLHQKIIVRAIRIMVLPCGVWIFLLFFLLDTVGAVLAISKSLHFDVK
jgi:hypothetical protein